MPDREAKASKKPRIAVFMGPSLIDHGETYVTTGKDMVWRWQLKAQAPNLIPLAAALARGG
jgi:hypothetical protein